MKTFAWLTDPHLNFLTTAAMDAFSEQLRIEDVDGLMITGDIAEADSVVPLMEHLDGAVPYPIYFVLGNHDYYGSSVEKTRGEVGSWAKNSQRSHWLPNIGIISLSETTALIGHGGWGDGRIGDFLGSGIALNDYRHIADLTNLPKFVLHERLMALGDEAAEFIHKTLLEALQSHDEVVLLTHVPPFLESCWYEGQIVLSEWTPHFTCGAVGDVLSKVMQTHPSKNLRVYCGHTHNGGTAQILPNLTVYTGDAEYNRPTLLERIIVR